MFSDSNGARARPRSDRGSCLEHLYDSNHFSCRQSLWKSSIIVAILSAISTWLFHLIHDFIRFTFFKKSDKNSAIFIEKKSTKKINKQQNKIRFFTTNSQNRQSSTTTDEDLAIFKKNEGFLVSKMDLLNEFKSQIGIYTAPIASTKLKRIERRRNEKNIPRNIDHLRNNVEKAIRMVPSRQDQGERVQFIKCRAQSGKFGSVFSSESIFGDGNYMSSMIINLFDQYFINFWSNSLDSLEIDENRKRDSRTSWTMSQQNNSYKIKNEEDENTLQDTYEEIAWESFEIGHSYFSSFILSFFSILIDWFLIPLFSTTTRIFLSFSSTSFMRKEEEKVLPLSEFSSIGFVQSDPTSKDVDKESILIPILMPSHSSGGDVVAFRSSVKTIGPLFPQGTNHLAKSYQKLIKNNINACDRLKDLRNYLKNQLNEYNSKLLRSQHTLFAAPSVENKILYELSYLCSELIILDIVPYHRQERKNHAKMGTSTNNVGQDRSRSSPSLGPEELWLHVDIEACARNSSMAQKFSLASISGLNTEDSWNNSPGAMSIQDEHEESTINGTRILEIENKTRGYLRFLDYDGLPLIEPISHESIWDRRIWSSFLDLYHFESSACEQAMQSGIDDNTNALVALAALEKPFRLSLSRKPVGGFCIILHESDRFFIEIFFVMFVGFLVFYCSYFMFKGKKFIFLMSKNFRVID